MDKFRKLSLKEMVKIDGGGKFWRILGALALGFVLGFVIESIYNK
jgi:hypothetical protein